MPVIGWPDATSGRTRDETNQFTFTSFGEPGKIMVQMDTPNGPRLVQMKKNVMEKWLQVQNKSPEPHSSPEDTKFQVRPTKLLFERFRDCSRWDRNIGMRLRNWIHAPNMTNQTSDLVFLTCYRCQHCTWHHFRLIDQRSIPISYLVCHLWGWNLIE